MASSSSRKSASSASNRKRRNARAVRAGSAAGSRTAGRGGRRTPTVTRSTTRSGRTVASVRVGDLPKSGRRTSGSLRGTRSSGTFTTSVSGRSAAARDRKSVKQEERSKPKRSKKPLIVLGIVFAVVVALVVGVVVLFQSPVFVIEDVQVRGADHLTQTEIDQLVVVPEGATLLTVDAEAIERSLKRDAWVQSVSVSREFPATLGVNVTERPVGAIVEVPVGTAQTIQRWAISPDGIWLMAIPSEDSEIGRNISPRIYEDVEAAMHIIDVDVGVKPEIGAQCTDEPVLNALAIVSGMSTELAQKVKLVSATDAESTMLTLDNAIEIAFGKAENIRDKERVCLEIIAKAGEGKVAYINVRDPERPTYRAA